MTPEQKKERFLAMIKAMPDKERNSFWRGIVDVCEAGRKAGIPAQEWGAYCAETYNEVNRQMKENT
tara:strand:- start:634 stop:831 length:198 start_codon:yes stop_codon:yes gene_type:complete